MLDLRREGLERAELDRGSMVVGIGVGSNVDWIRRGVGGGNARWGDDAGKEELERPKSAILDDKKGGRGLAE
jgi:hypothetical protein